MLGKSSDQEFVGRSFGAGVLGLAAVALLGLTARCAAQTDASSALSSAESAAAAPAVSAAPAAAPATGLVGLVSSIFSSCHGCKVKCCNTPFGQLLNNAVKPFSMMTGGVIPQPCKTINDDPANKVPGGGAGGDGSGPPGPVAAASKIKKEEAQAKVRREAVRYLGTVDCHYFPEAEAALITALRTDRNECVRWEAAMAFSNGCCCTKKTIEALTIVVSGSDKDGNPSETSPRVKLAAFNALQWCVACYSEELPEPQQPEYPPEKQPAAQPLEPIPRPKPEPPRPEYPDAVGANLPQDRAVVQLVGYYEQLDKKPMARVLAEARRALADAQVATKSNALARTGKTNLYDLWIAAAPQTQSPASDSATGLASRSPDAANDESAARLSQAPRRPTPARPISSGALPQEVTEPGMAASPAGELRATTSADHPTNRQSGGSLEAGGLVQPDPSKLWMEDGGRPRLAPAHSSAQEDRRTMASSVEPASWSGFGNGAPIGMPPVGHDRSVQFSTDYAQPRTEAGNLARGRPAQAAPPRGAEGYRLAPRYDARPDRFPHTSQPMPGRGVAPANDPTSEGYSRAPGAPQGPAPPATGHQQSVGGAVRAVLGHYEQAALSQRPTAATGDFSGGRTANGMPWGYAGSAEPGSPVGPTHQSFVPPQVELPGRPRVGPPNSARQPSDRAMMYPITEPPLDQNRGRPADVPSERYPDTSTYRPLPSISY